MNKPNLLITGGLGNLGSWIVEEAVKDFNVTVLTKSFREVIIDGGYELIIADLSDEQQLQDKLRNKEFQYIIHAGSANDTNLEGYSQFSYEVNSFGTRNLLNALNLENVKHFIYLSTFHVYGLSEGFINEETKTNPKNDYAMSHLFAEYFISMGLQDLKYSIVRLTNSYGCPKDSKSSKWYLILNDLSKLAFYKKEIILKSDGKAIRDFVWMGDVCLALMQLLKLNPKNEIYNLSRGKTLSLRDIANEVQIAYKEYFDKSIPISYNNNDDSTPHQSLSVCSNKIKSILDVKYQDMFVQEAIKIFKLLESKS
jgi:UDP-glucose 4-epimerase